MFSTDFFLHFDRYKSFIKIKTHKKKEELNQIVMWL